ncbi:MAG TPA: hypothetical protein ENH75_07670 [archaeon]|nr:hypothetical protein [archaeon]
MMDNDIDDIVDELKRNFKIDSEVFDVDFIFIPESDFMLKKNLHSENAKGFKISYHFEPGMKKPGIKIEENIDNKKIREYLKDINSSKAPRIRDIYDHRKKTEIDASELSLDVYKSKEESPMPSVLEPFTEISEDDLSIEILVEIPGMNKEDVDIILKDEGRIFMVTAENENRKYMKTIPFPFKTSLKNYRMEVNNGIATIKVIKAIK